MTDNTETPAGSTEPAKKRIGKKTTMWIGGSAIAALALGGAGIAVAAEGLGDDSDNRDNLSGSSLERASEAALSETGQGEVTDAERDDGGYEIDIRLPDGTEVDVYLDEAFDVRGVDPENDRDDDGQNGEQPGSAADRTPLTDDEIARASEAALAEAGAGTVADVDRSDDLNEAFEVEIRLENGDEIEVELDDGYEVVGTEFDALDSDD